ncbi:MAG TPA: potassium channel family protein [Tepidisphaeraceae bacterium]|nr:potassium channel family protein [Tepidisphaeraceae bacterium]
MRLLGTLAGIVLIILTLVDGFETILQPRRVTHRFRYARLFYRSTWRIWRILAMRFSVGKRREAFLSVFGPLSLLGLFTSWVIGLILGFALILWSRSYPLAAPESHINFLSYLYLSGTTFFTLGYGDITPMSGTSRALCVIEAGMGFAFLAVLITYLPVLYQAFSRREATISLMDARAGSPPSAAQLLLRAARSGSIAQVEEFLGEWEHWAAELLESHLSFPVLSYYRSQHDNQSWLAVLTTILDTTALLMVAVEQYNSYRAQLTFAMARHAAVDLALVLRTPAMPLTVDRFPPDAQKRLRQALKEAGLPHRSDEEVARKIGELRGMYEPFVNALAQRLLFTLPPVMGDEGVADNWQRSAWMQRTPGIGSLPAATHDGGHFD